MTGRFHSVTLLVLVAIVLPAKAEQVLYRSQDWVVSAPDKIDCSKPIPLTAKGPKSLLDDSNRALMESVTAAVSPALTKQCPGASEMVIASGRMRRLLSFRAGSTSVAGASPTVASSDAQLARTAAPRTPVPSAASSSLPPASAQSPPLSEQSLRPADAPARTVLTAAEQKDVVLAGTWIGIYQVYPSYVQMTLEITAEPAANGEARAQLRVEGLEGKNAPHMGVTPATIRYGAQARTLDIRAIADGMRRTNLSGLAYHAVYDSERGVFAGYRVNASSDASPYVVLVRKGGEGKLFKRIGDMPNGAVSTRPSLPIGGSAPSADALRAWAGQIYKQYPNVDPYRTESGALYTMARNLFRDEYFTPHFGKPYDQLSGSDLGKIYRRLEDMPAPRANFPEDKGNSAGIPMARGFWLNTGTYAAPDIMLSVVALRSISSWMNETMRRLPTMAPAADAFATLNAVEAEERAALSMLWPSERTAFLALIDEQRARLADPVLTSKVSQLIGSAGRFEDVPSLQSAINTLQQRQSAPAPRAAPATPTRRGMTPTAARRAGSSGEDIGSLSSMASDSVRQQLRGSMEEKVAALVDAGARKDAASIASFPAGAAGLEAGMQWHSEMERKFSSFRQAPAVSAMFSLFGQTRSQQFTQAAPELRTRVATLQSADEIKSVLARYAGISTDSAIPAAQSVYAAARERQVELDRQAAERARIAAAEVAKKEREAREKAESAWRRKMPPESETIRIGLADMNFMPNSKPLQQAMAAVFTVDTPDGFGSAFLITKDGLAITNYHVVEGASAIHALFSSGQKFAARVWRTDAENDFALIQIDCPKDCYTSYLTSDPLPASGTDVYTIGTPKAFANTITKGIVSGLRRSGAKIDIQSDAAINKGNSGGPMIEAETGRVIGVVTKKRTDADGIGFAGSILDALRLLGVTLE